MPEPLTSASVHRKGAAAKSGNVSGSVSQLAERVVSSQAFQYFIVGVILAAGLLAGLETSAVMRAKYGTALRTLDIVILGIFILELFLKLASHGRQPWRYFGSGWNIFDFLVIVVCCLPLDSQFAVVFRLARVLRLLRLVTVLPRLQLLVGALLKSLGAMGYVSLLLALVFYMYGVGGVHLFGKHAPEEFGSLPAALLSLLRMITLDNWNDLFLAARAGAPISAAVYFVTFILLGTMIMLNLFIGIIMNSMSEMHSELVTTESSANQTQDSGEMEQLLALEQQMDAMRGQISRVRMALEEKKRKSGRTT